MLAAILPLAAGLAIDLGVVTRRLLPDAPGVAAAAVAAFMLLAATWFGLPLAVRALRRGGAHAPAHA